MRGQGVIVLNYDGWFSLDIRKKIFTASGIALPQIIQRHGGCLLPGNIQGQTGEGSEQPDPDEDIPAHCKALD